MSAPAPTTATATQPEGRAWGQRPALDGLRTLAVYLVLLFHAGAGWFDGGFVGVDLFFVLSGFLVTTILVEELAATGRLDLLRFYDRRVRRLLPAAVLLVLVTSLALVLTSSVLQRYDFVPDARAALLYYANWHFLAESQDYFGAETFDASPFLHFWSLSIEEQYYAFFPVLLWAAWRLRHRFRYAVPALVLGLFVWSLGEQLYWGGQDVNHAYYATSTRLYQLLAGSLLALLLFRQRQLRGPVPAARLVPLTSLVGLVGLLAIGTSVLDLSPSARGLWATLFGVLAVGGVAGLQRHPVARLLEQPVLVYLGRISYGTYLWHWPVIVIAGQYLRPSLGFVALAAVLATGLASASYHAFERPIRTRRVPPRWRAPVVAAGLSVSALAAFVVVPVALNSPVRPPLIAASDAPEVGPGNVTGPPPRIDYLEFGRTRGAPERVCAPETLAACRVHTGEDGPTLWVMGDSQAREIEPALTHLAQEKHFNLYLSAIDGCPWPSGMVRVAAPRSRQQLCQQQKDDLPELFELAGVDVTLMIQQGREGEKFAGQLGTKVGGEPVGEDDLAALYSRTVDRTLREHHREGVRTILLESAWLPPDDGNPLACLAARDRVQDCAVAAPDGPLDIDRIYRREASSRPDAFDVTISPLLCPARPVCDAVRDDIPVYRDPRHYSPPVLDHVRERIWRLIQRSGAWRGLD